jgi:hypothetical protein
MAGTIWIPEAEDLPPVGSSGAMLGGPPRVVWHTTEAPSGYSKSGVQYFNVMDDVLTGKKAEPHILWDPVTDRLGQYFPLDRSSRALRNDPDNGISTNKTGVTCIQIEVVAYASTPFTGYWKPGPNGRALMAAIRSWGIPDRWPAGAMSKAGESVSRSASRWLTEAGHYGHCHVPGNTHWDCGAIDQQTLFTALGAPPPAAPTLEEEDDDMLPTIVNVVDSTGRNRGSWLLDSIGYHNAGNTEVVRSLRAAKAKEIIINTDVHDAWRREQERLRSLGPVAAAPPAV